MRTHSLAALIVCGLLSCKTAITVEEMDKRLGPRPTAEQMKETAKSSIADSLFDPMSAVYYFENPFRIYKGYIPANFVEGAKVGWTIPFWVNAKNRLGGYVGRTKYYFTSTLDGNYYIEADLVEGFGRQIQLTDPFEPELQTPDKPSAELDNATDAHALTFTQRVDSLVPGISVEEVKAVMGSPESDARSSLLRILRYSGEDNGTHVSVTLVFKDNKRLSKNNFAELGRERT